MSVRVAVLGASGRMGTAITKALDASDQFDLVARLGSADSLEMLTTADVDVAVDVSTTDAARSALPWLAAHGIHAVVGTTGFDAADIASFDTAFKDAGRVCYLVPNFSVSAVLIMRFAEMAAEHFDGVEIIEMHHNQKRDAPSGTAKLTAERIDAARSTPWAPDPTEHETVAGVRGGEAASGLRIHSVRLPGLVAHQEVVFGTAGETLSLRHDNYDRAAYGPGVMMAINGLSKLEPGLTVGLDAVLR